MAKLLRGRKTKAKGVPKITFKKSRVTGTHIKVSRDDLPIGIVAKLSIPGKKKRDTGFVTNRKPGIENARIHNTESQAVNRFPKSIRPKLRKKL